MNNLEKIKKAQSNKEKSKKIAEIIWVTVGGVILFAGFACLILSIIVNNIGTDTTNMKNSPLYPLIPAQDAFVNWWNSWCFYDIKTFASLGILLVIIAAIYLLIVFAVYASQKDADEKKLKAKKLRERNAQRFLNKEETPVVEAEATPVEETANA